MSKVREIISQLGGVREVASYLDISTQGIQYWINKNTIPAINIPALGKLIKIKKMPNLLDDLEDVVSKRDMRTFYSLQKLYK